MASALATLRKLQALDGITHMQAMGQRLRKWPGRAGEGHGFGIRQSGPPQTGAWDFQTLPQIPDAGSRGRPGSRANWPTRCTSTW